MDNITVKDVFYFDRMLTSQIIQLLYWFLLLSAALSGLGLMASGSFFGGLITLVGGAIGSRIFCELMIVVFKMNEALQVIRNKQEEIVGENPE